MKKVLLIFLCAALMFTSFIVVTAAEPTIVCEVSDTEVKMGETFTVSVSV